MIIGFIIILIVTLTPLFYRQNQRLRVIEEKLNRLDDKNIK